MRYFKKCPIYILQLTTEWRMSEKNMSISADTLLGSNLEIAKFRMKLKKLKKEFASNKNLLQRVISREIIPARYWNISKRNKCHLSIDSLSFFPRTERWMKDVFTTSWGEERGKKEREDIIPENYLRQTLSWRMTGEKMLKPWMLSPL